MSSLFCHYLSLLSFYVYNMGVSRLEGGNYEGRGEAKRPPATTSRVKYFKLVFWRFLLGFQGLDPSRKLEDAPAVHFHLVASLTEDLGPSYCQKTGHMLPRFPGALMCFQAVC